MNPETASQINLLRTGPSINKGKSRQDFATPWEFVRAVEKRFGEISFDLAASVDNQKGPKGLYFSESDNALIQDWGQLKGLLFLNPPFGNIEPWAAKCRESSQKGARIILLVPASVGSVWHALHVHEHAKVYFFRPRLSFDGINSFPRDCMAVHYGVDLGYDLWKWK